MLFSTTSFDWVCCSCSLSQLSDMVQRSLVRIMIYPASYCTPGRVQLYPGLSAERRWGCPDTWREVWLEVRLACLVSDVGGFHTKMEKDPQKGRSPIQGCCHGHHVKPDSRETEDQLGPRSGSRSGSRDTWGLWCWWEGLSLLKWWEVPH